MSWEERREGKDWGESGVEQRDGLALIVFLLPGLESQRHRKVLSATKLKSHLNHRISGIELGLPFLALRVIFWCVFCFLYCELVCLFFFYVAQLCNNVLMFFLFKSPEIFN